MKISAKSQIIVNVGFALIKSAFLMWSIRLADQTLTPVVMGAILLFRRQGVFYGNLTQLGFSQSIIKFCGVADRSAKSNQLIANMVKLVFALATILSVGAFFWGEALGKFALGNSGPLMAFWLVVYATGIAFGYLAGSAWRSELHFSKYNVVDWLNGSLIFVLCLLVFPSDGSLEDLSMTLAVGTLVSSVGFLGWFLIHKGYMSSLLKPSLAIDRKVLLFGFSRGVAAFADAGTIVIGPWLLRNDPEKSGFLIISYTLVRIAQAVVLPVAQVFALRANSKIFNTQDEEKRLVQFTLFSIVASILFCIFYYVAGWKLLRYWIPDSWQQVNEILFYIIIFTPAVCGFYALRNHVDLKYSSPINLFFLALAVGIYIAVAIGMVAIGFDSLKAATYASCAMFSLFYLYTIYFIWAFGKRRNALVQ
ncbi:hypothetical protein WKR98_10025 [Pigmentiphaga sp. YJ18]|uniref:hypothetical protein n=1 Tax=Pigmentiphaga sp. YJ18 TaxID=3134907 RepID=UPI00310CB90F